MLNREQLLIPGAIVVAGICIALAILFTGAQNASGTPNPGQKLPAGNINDIRPVTSADHIIGSPNSQILLVEYSDLECPYCKEFHATLKKLAADYAGTGKVAWVYRHFPLDKHPQATVEAEASECVTALGGENAFWQFIDHIFEVTPSNNQFDLSLLPQFAKEAGVDEAQFSNCLSAHTYKQKVVADYANAIATGADATPWTIVVIPKTGEKAFINGAQSYDNLKKSIESVLSQGK